ncbi:MAG: alpha/beta fold hydrolase, partial [Bacteroidales bacterium]|nr:alpha/beta fold hydrolase [Bacteroidales bacterium]
MKNTKILNYKTSGEGETIVFLHGYLESMEIWNQTFLSLKEKCKIILIDLPGHGKSPVFSNIHSMDFMAEKVNEVLEIEKVEKISLFGHSMGGYVALAFAALFPEKLNKLVTIHSHPFADGEEKLKDRTREVELILSGKKQLIFSVSIPRLYADINLDAMKEKIDFSKRIADEMQEDAIAAALEGMKLRTDKTEIFSDKRFQKHIIIGRHDNLIPADKLINFAEEN